MTTTNVYVVSAISLSIQSAKLHSILKKYTPRTQQESRPDTATLTYSLESLALNLDLHVTLHSAVNGTAGAKKALKKVFRLEVYTLIRGQVTFSTSLCHVDKQVLHH